MKTTNEKLAEEIRVFKNTGFSDNPPLTAEQMAQIKPSHYRPQNRPNMANFKPIKKAVYVRLDADVNEHYDRMCDEHHNKYRGIFIGGMTWGKIMKN